MTKILDLIAKIFQEPTGVLGFLLFCALFQNQIRAFINVLLEKKFNIQLGIFKKKAPASQLFEKLYDQKNIFVFEPNIIITNPTDFSTFLLVIIDQHRQSGKHIVFDFSKIEKCELNFIIAWKQTVIDVLSRNSVFLTLVFSETGSKLLDQMKSEFDILIQTKGTQTINIIIDRRRLNEKN